MNPLRAARRYAKKRYDEARGRTNSLTVVTEPKLKRTLNRQETRDLYRANHIPLSLRRRRHSPSRWRSFQTLEERWYAQAARDYVRDQERLERAA